MEIVSLDASLMRRRPAELSGGQQQRVGIARGLALKPRLLIADEPVSSLDASVQAQVLNLLAALPRLHGLTLILISHSLFALHYLCTRISVMYQGRIVEEASVAQFFEKALHPYSSILLDSVPVLRSDKRRRTGIAKEEAFHPLESSCSFYPRCPKKLPMCSSAIPPLREISPDQKVACFLY
jgi:oligopeptide/dipeptide ABC transporter ATP-binding protein